MRAQPRNVCSLLRERDFDNFAAEEVALREGRLLVQRVPRPNVSLCAGSDDECSRGWEGGGVPDVVEVRVATCGHQFRFADSIEDLTSK
jgi:hypothetical protein